MGENSQAIPMLVKKILDKNNPIIVWGSGEQAEHIYMRMTVQNYENNFTKWIHRRTSNIGLDKTISIKDLVNLICKVNKIYPKIKFDKTKPEGRFIKRSDTSKLKIFYVNIKFLRQILKMVKKMSQWYYENFKKW